MLKKLLSSVREYKKDSILAPVFVALEVVMEVIIPMLMSLLIDNGIDANNMTYVYTMGGILIVCSLVSLLFGALSGKCSAVAASGFAKNLRHDMFHNVQNFSFSNIDKFKTSSIITRLTTDVTNVQMAYMMVIRIAVRCPLMLVFALTMSMIVNYRIAWIFFIIAPILGVALFFIMKNVHPIFTRMFKNYDKLNNVVQENVRGIRVVKSFVREDHESDKFTGVSKLIRDDSVRAERILMLTNPLIQFCVFSLNILIAWFSARLIVAGDMTTGELSSMILYAAQILMSLMMVSMVIVMISISRASAQRITEILSEESDITNPENPITEVADGTIDFNDVSFSYAKDIDKCCLNHLDFHAKPGQIIGVLGGTGCGKSSLVQLISRLYDVTAGEVKVGGKNVKEYDLDVLRNQVAVVLQKNVLFSGTIKDNLRWGNPNATDEEMIAACKIAQAHDFVMAFPDKYDTHIEQDGANVSGGQKQRLCIARAIISQPKVLILDDSTSAVDTATDSKIREAFRKDIPDVTKIIIAQRVSSVEDADLILIMENGKIVAQGKHDDLLAGNDIYQEIYYSQKKGGLKS